ncbi:MAG: hypothetical protein ACLFU7_05680 [Armatimonadota bacterium]
MRISTVVLLTAALLLTGTAVMAQDTINNTWVGMTGLAISPSADTAPALEFIGSFNYIDTDGDSTEIFSAIFGLTDNFEVGLASLDAGGSSETIGNLKYNFDLAELAGGPTPAQLAIGVWDLGDEIDRAWYVVVSDDFRGSTQNARWSVGLAGSDGGILDGLFGGVEFDVSEQGLIQIDYDSDNLNAAYRHRVSDRFGVGLGIVDGDPALNAAYNTGF